MSLARHLGAVTVLVLCSVAVLSCGCDLSDFLSIGEWPFGNADANVVSGAMDLAEPSLAGLWECTVVGQEEGAWDDADAPLVQWLTRDGEPFADWGRGGGDDRMFILFDANNTMVGSYEYDAGEHVVFVGTTADTGAFLGETMERLPDGRLQFDEAPISVGEMEGVDVSATMGVVARTEDGGATWLAETTTTVQVTLQADVPADPNAGRPAASAGAQAVYTIRANEQITPSAALQTLFPDAEWRLREREGGDGTPPTGYFEVSGPDWISRQWSDPDSAIIPWIDEAMGGGPIDDSEEPMINSGEKRVFGLFGADGRFVMTFDYDPEGNVVTVAATPEDDALIGQMPTQIDEDDAWRWLGSYGPFRDPSQTVEFVMTAELIVGPGDLSEGRKMRLRQIVTVTVLQDVEADAGTGRPAIPAGASVTFNREECYWITASESPYELFPDAEIVVGASGGEQEGLPVGYYELSGAHESDLGWQDANCPLTQLLTGDCLPTGLVPEGKRVFILFDNIGTLAQCYDYAQADHTVTFHSVEENLLMGVPAEPTQDRGSWAWGVNRTVVAGSIQITVQGGLQVGPEDGEEGRDVEVMLWFIYTAIEDIPADPGTGRPAIMAGTTAVYLMHEKHAMASSEGPFELFPDALFQDARD